MGWEEIHHRLLEGLQVELRNRWGRVAEIEERLECSDGYLGKLCKGRNEFKLDFFLRSIEAMGLDPRGFFSRTLALQPTPEDFLEQLEDPEDRDPAFTRMARATLELEASEPPPPHDGASADASDVEKFMECARSEQLRRLRETHRYRTHAFASAYLERLDSLRYDDAVEAAHLARGVAAYLIPALPGPQSARLSMQCLALGIFGSARRLKGEFTTAARAFRLALEVSRRADLRGTTAKLLQRGSYLLKDFGHFERARDLLDRALVIYVQIGSPHNLGCALVDHGMMCTALGEYHTAILDLERALSYLEKPTNRPSRNHLAAFQFLAYANEQLGDFATAEACLERGENEFASEHTVDQAKLRWLRGTLAFRRSKYVTSEQLLREAHHSLAHHENALQEAVVTLDLLRSMLAQGKTAEACKLATSMAQLVMKFKDNRYAEATIVDLITVAIAGRLTDEIVSEVRSSLVEERASRPSLFD
ncbi:MAG: hypothetical protein GY719_13270 [bacterium]|nr:hypothetical protein [bacterium]